MNPIRRHANRYLAVLLFSLSFSAQSCEPEEPNSTVYLSAESPVTQPSALQVGQGPHTYRFVVRDPQNISRPYRHARYQVQVKGEATFPDGSNVYRGITDNLGRTAVFRFTEAVPLTEWFVQPLFGQGELGEHFRLTSQGDCPSDLVDYPYMVSIENGPIFCGRTLPGGNTPRFMSTEAGSVRLYTVGGLPADACRQLEKRANLVMAGSTASQRIAGLKRLRRDRNLANYADFVEVLDAKIDSQILRHGSLSQVEALVKHRLSNIGEVSPDKQSDIYNSVGYTLLIQKSPRYLAYAGKLLDESRSLNENRSNLDSRAWYLHLSGQDTAALELVNRSISLFGKKCTEDARSTYQEILAHRGMMLWTLRQRQQALDDWAQAEMIATGGGWANFTPSWKYLGPVIRNRAAQMRGDGFVPTVCTETEPDETEETSDVDTPAI